jgi:hypothetical protein
MVTRKAKESEGPVTEYQKFAMTSQGPMMAPAARDNITGRDITFLS